MILQKIYEKNSDKVRVSDKFIYCSSVYKLWSNGASLVDERYYSSSKPINLKKKQLKCKDLFRFFELEYAPEEWLQQNNYKLIN